MLYTKNITMRAGDDERRINYVWRKFNAYTSTIRHGRVLVPGDDKNIIISYDFYLLTKSGQM